MSKAACNAFFAVVVTMVFVLIVAVGVTGIVDTIDEIDARSEQAMQDQHMYDETSDYYEEDLQEMK